MKLRNIAGILVASALTISASFARAETYVLLVGICDYPTPVDASGKPLKNAEGAIVDNDLRGAVNDVNSLKDVLTTSFGVKTENIRMLTDKAASSDNLIREFKWLLSSAKAGDQIFFGFSGHGASIPVDGSVEADGKEEVLVLGDDSLIPDDLFGTLKDEIAKAGINATYYFDSCHSGGMSRDIQGRSKYIEFKNLSKRSKLINEKAFKFEFKSKGKAEKSKESSVMIAPAQAVNKARDGKGEYAFLFSSKEEQTSIDAKLDGFPAHGLFTLAFTEVLKAEAKFPMGELMPAIQGFFKENKIEQTPMWEFSSEKRGQLPFIL